MNNYCEKCNRIRPFILRRTNEGTVWECEVCHFVITDISKYKKNYYGLPVPEPKV
jgi:ribosomal protein L37AE/L43A